MRPYCIIYHFKKPQPENWVSFAIFDCLILKFQLSHLKCYILYFLFFCIQAVGTNKKRLIHLNSSKRRNGQKQSLNLGVLTNCYDRHCSLPILLYIIRINFMQAYKSRGERIERSKFWYHIISTLFLKSPIRIHIFITYLYHPWRHL